VPLHFNLWAAISPVQEITHQTDFLGGGVNATSKVSLLTQALTHLLQMLDSKFSLIVSRLSFLVEKANIHGHHQKAPAIGINILKKQGTLELCLNLL
jgi:hypothetical protein